MLGILRLLIIWRLLRLARPLILTALVLTATTLTAHGIAGNGARPNDQAASVIRSLQHVAAPLRNRLEHALAVGLEPRGGR